MTVDARKTALGLKEARPLLDRVDVVYSIRRTRVERLDLRRDRPDDATLKRLLIGPTGRLRAPTFVAGRTLLVGFDEATYRKVLGTR